MQERTVFTQAKEMIERMKTASKENPEGLNAAANKRDAITHSILRNLVLANAGGLIVSLNVIAPYLPEMLKTQATEITNTICYYLYAIVAIWLTAVFSRMSVGLHFLQSKTATVTIYIVSVFAEFFAVIVFFVTSAKLIGMLPSLTL